MMQFRQTLPGLPDLPDRKIKKVAATIPDWLPQKLAGALRSAILGVGLCRFTFSRGERQIMRRRRSIAISEWSGRHRHVRMSSIPGRWSNEFTPYLVGIMDAASFPGLEVIIICKAPQTGGSEAGHNIVGYAIDRAPGPVLYVFPDENTARENAEERIIPMLEDSPRLREYLTGNADDLSKLHINLTNMIISLGWSGSVARLGNKPIRYLILDELNKYKNSKSEANSEALAEKRVTTWRDRGRLTLKISTPTTKEGAITVAFEQEANCRFDFWVLCPKCAKMQLMTFDRIVWSAEHRAKLLAQLAGGNPEETGLTEKTILDPEVVLAKRLAEYCCEHCGSFWDDHGRDLAVRKGEWRERGTGLELRAYLELHKPLKAGFHIPSWISYFVSLSEVAHAFLKWKKSGKLDDLKNFVTQHKAEAWEVQHDTRETDSILTLCDSRPRGVVPAPEERADEGARRPPVAALLAAVDTQGQYFRYVIRAFAYGSSGESWLVQCGMLAEFDDVATVLWHSVYKDAKGREHRVRNSIIDAMGNRTKKVYEFCLANRTRIVPYQGADRLSEPIKLSPQEYFPDEKGNRIKMPGVLLLHRVDTKFFKDDLAARLNIAPDDPGAFHLHADDNGQLAEYAKEMCAEVWSEEDQAWTNPHQRPNHYWDCEVMLQALAWKLNIRQWPLPDEREREFASNAPPMPQGRGRGMSVGERLAAVRR